MSHSKSAMNTKSSPARVHTNLMPHKRPVIPSSNTRIDMMNVDMCNLLILLCLPVIFFVQRRFVQ